TDSRTDSGREAIALLALAGAGPCLRPLKGHREPADSRVSSAASRPCRIRGGGGVAMQIGPRSWRRIVASAPQQRLPRSDAARVQVAGGASGASSAADAAPDAARIERGCEMTGTLALARPLVVEGDFRGAIECESSVLVSEGGSVVATIRARSVVIRGA